MIVKSCLVDNVSVDSLVVGESRHHQIRNGGPAIRCTDAGHIGVASRGETCLLDVPMDSKSFVRWVGMSKGARDFSQ